MREFIRIMWEITTNTIENTLYFVKSNLMRFANIINFILPYAMYFVGQYTAKGNGQIHVGAAIIIPVVVMLFTYYFKSYANKIGKGITVPVPEKRFTSIDDDGEVSVEHRRLQELILYIADVEDWLEKKGML